MQGLSSNKSNTTSATTSTTKKPTTRTTTQRRNSNNKNSVRTHEDDYYDRDELDREGREVDKTVYETAGIIDRIDRLKSKVEGELTKEASKSRWFSECQRSIEEKKVNKGKSDHTEPLSTLDKSATLTLSSTGSIEL